MRLSNAVSLLLPTIISADLMNPLPRVTPAPSPSRMIPSEQIPSLSTIPATFTSPTPSHPPHAWDPIISGASVALEELNEYLHIDLRKRQGGAPITAPPATGTVVTQMPPVTTYDMNDGVARVYTQLFVAVPDQWPSPSAGTIGLGTIQGQIGVVKTNSKRGAMPEATAAPGQTLRIKGREVVVS